MAEADRALVFGLDTQIGLTVVRELAAHGVTVYGVGHDRRAVGLSLERYDAGGSSRRAKRPSTSSTGSRASSTCRS